MNIAWITGADRGVGFYLAIELALRGWHVVASGDDESSLRRLLGRSRGMEGTIMPIRLDMSRTLQMLECVQAIEEKVGPITHALFCHSPDIAQEGEAFSAEKLEDTIKHVVSNTVRGLEAVMPYFIERRTGVVGVLNSYLGYRGLPGFACYGAAYSALETLCESLSFTLDQYGVRMMVMTPGLFEEEVLQNSDSIAPFLISPQVAAEQFCDALSNWSFEQLTPHPLRWAFRLLRLMPNALYRRFINKHLPERRALFAEVEEHEAAVRAARQQQGKTT